MEVQNDDNKLATSRLSPLSTPSDTPRVSRFAAPCISPINTPISTPPDTPLMTRQTSLPTTTVTPLQQLLNTVEEDSHKMVLQDLRELLGVLGHTDIKTSVLAQFENINWSGSRSEMEEIVKAVQTCGRQHLHGYDLAMFNHMIGTQQQIRDMYVARSNQLRDNITQLNNDIGQYATRLVETRHYH
ncbi:MAG: hypothetical protein IT497_05750 [Ottowia sp.]|nr:hypothetical protein [Ottowia sp.]